MRQPSPIVTSPEYLGPGANDHPVANPRRSTPAATVTQRHPVVQGTAVPDTRRGMHDDAPEMMDAQARADLGLSRDGDAGGDLGRTFHEESQGLCRNPTLVSTSERRDTRTAPETPARRVR